MLRVTHFLFIVKSLTVVLEFRLYKWLRANTYDRLSVSAQRSGYLNVEQQVWKEREDAESAMKSYLSDFPSKYCASTPSLSYNPPSFGCFRSWATRKWQV